MDWRPPTKIKETRRTTSRSVEMFSLATVDFRYGWTLSVWHALILLVAHRSCSVSACMLHPAGVAILHSNQQIRLLLINLFIAAYKQATNFQLIKLHLSKHALRAQIGAQVLELFFFPELLTIDKLRGIISSHL